MTAQSKSPSGVLLIDKPAEVTSAAVVAKIKRSFGFAKVGHGGTLDPFATGLLVVLVNEGTKAARFLLQGRKKYYAKVSLGSTTNTGDHTGIVVKTFSGEKLPDLALWETSKRNFLGTIRQKPPLFSAIKVNGQALYKYARRGEAVEVEERDAEIFSIEDVALAQDNLSLSFTVACSGGTYIRTLAEDWAASLGVPAHLAELRRLESSPFSLQKAITLDTALDFAARGARENLPLLPLQAALSHLPTLHCNAMAAIKLRQGNIMAFRENVSLSPLQDYEEFQLVLENGENPVAILNRAMEIERVFQ